jgi:hypothetical protein
MRLPVGAILVIAQELTHQQGEYKIRPYPRNQDTSG